MNEPEKQLNNEGLLPRIATLESENASLTARIVELEKRATRSDGFILHLTKQVGAVIQEAGLTDLQVLNLMAKVFPDYIRSQGQIDRIFTPADKPGQTKSDMPD